MLSKFRNGVAVMPGHENREQGIFHGHSMICITFHFKFLFDSADKSLIRL